MPPSPRRFFQLPLHEKTALLQAAVLLGTIMLLLRTVGIQRTRAMIEPKGQTADTAGKTQAPPDMVTSLARAMDRASALWRRSNCLDRSLGLAWLLARKGIPARLQIGVRKKDDGLDAHAWVECGGTPIGSDGARSEEFISFDNLPLNLRHSSFSGHRPGRRTGHHPT